MSFISGTFTRSWRWKWLETVQLRGEKVSMKTGVALQAGEHLQHLFVGQVEPTAALLQAFDNNDTAVDRAGRASILRHRHRASVGSHLD
jgi:hypothetical protein